MRNGRVYAVQVMGGREARARREIARRMGDAVQDCFTPQVELPKKVRGEWRRTTCLLFPGYVFVQTARPEELLRTLKSVRGFTRLLGVADGRILPLTEDEVAWLDAMTDVGEHAMGMSEAVQEGDRIVVKRGPLKGHEAQIRKVDRHKRTAWIDIHMLGRRTTVKVGLEVVRKSGA